MANNPKKAQDATEAAMAAIQEALNVRDAEMKASGPKSAPVPDSRGPAPETRKAASAPVPSVELRQPLGTRPENDAFSPETVEPGRPANDDWKSVGQILQNTRKSPSRTLYIAAGIASAVWVVFALVLMTPFLSLLSQYFAPVLLALVVTFLAPIGFFFAIAHTIVRSREMQALAQSMSEVALRLSEPEGAARESIVTVGQAIRREVAAMGDGVERALARAAELEVLVQNEVSSLERAYNDNEVRIRSLLDDLAAQRDNLIGQAEQVRNAITGVHLDLNQDITGISDQVAQQVATATEGITRELSEKSDHISAALNRVSDEMLSQLGERGGEIIERLAAHRA